MKQIIKSLLTMVFTIAVAVALVLFEGVIILDLWQWFVVPLFGLPKLALLQGIGLALTVGFLTHQGSASTMPAPKWLRKSITGGGSSPEQDLYMLKLKTMAITTRSDKFTKMINDIEEHSTELEREQSFFERQAEVRKNAIAYFSIQRLFLAWLMGYIIHLFM